ncbi:MAG: prolyl oligopeptidase family serine peptidase [Planctomycetaceae bacterium]|nr:prolyl oligopeptidase family serine peptidase [Planctomycetaceae bacterium]MBT5125753.1 prolyl oligopeptidase family serine peptidase [Planctomycetaceae bacterium]MBT5598393.1 prolyl oligopeptidase family serine peptidase [Planctomycetaceae bacterium]MBT5883516.1 prolyl oligopeptidase family serine peptidase [Planctomycetaceae bacterium]MBT6848107.1 prolyl oligopeptidase family serine peptidase [Planctomycetaceae bacterium]
MSRWMLCIAMCLTTAATTSAEKNVFQTRVNFQLKEHHAFTMIPPKADKTKPIPWIWYAPTLGQGLPGKHETWMFTKLHEHGIAIAGIDVGESYGSPQGRKLYQALYQELTSNKRFAPKPVLLARSRGGLMLYSWANKHPESVGGIAGIYPVCNLTSYPGVSRAAAAFGLTSAQLEERLPQLNPIEQLEPLAKAKVPIFHIQGDSDKVVPLEPNSKLLAQRITAAGGNAKVEVIKDQGHNLWEGWFHHEELTNFMIEHAKP